MVDDGLFVIPPSKVKFIRILKNSYVDFVIYNWLIIQKIPGQGSIWMVNLNYIQRMKVLQKDITFSIDTRRGTFEFFYSFHEKQGEQKSIISYIEGKLYENKT